MTKFTDRAKYFSKVGSHSNGQEILRLLWNSKVHYSVQKNPLVDHSLSHLNPLYTLALSSYKVKFGIILTSTSRFPKRSLSFRLSSL